MHGIVETRRARSGNDRLRRCPSLGAEFNMYIRFETPTRDEWSGYRTGLFQAAYALRRQDALEDNEAEQLSATLAWFGEHLRAPRSLPERAICWYREDAHDFIQRMWGLAQFVRTAGSPILMQRTRRPGTIAYTDRHQVAAIPYADTFRRPRRRGCKRPIHA